MPWPTAEPNKSLTTDGEGVPSGHLTDTTPHGAATNLEKTANKGAASGYAPLGADSKVPDANSQMPSTSFSGLSKITVSVSAPSSPTVGDLWVDVS